ncbi:MAG: ABC transporter permease [Verrucomicrobiales bacterium]|nr:ABC transporter permease [Verrucomicrobiales bacterium]
MSWLALASRNLLRNARRSITTIAAVALGYAAVNIFAGFSSYMFTSIRQAYIYDQANCHVQVWKKDARHYSGSDPGAYLLSAEEFEEIKQFASEDPRIELAAGMLEVRGNVDVDGTQSFFLGRAMVPSEQDAIHAKATSLRSRNHERFEGRPIADDTPEGIGITRGMQENFGIEVGADVILMGPDISGQLNATGAQVFQILDLASEALNNRFVYLPLELAQEYFSTDKVTCVRLLLKNEEETDAVAEDLREKFADRDWEVLPWYHVSDLYLRTKRMFDIIFGLVFVIIITIVTMSVLNTIGMAVVERTKEIGTLRAIGLKRPGVVKLFGIESGLLGVIGATVGLLLTAGFSLLIAGLKPTWEPPVTTRAVIWEIHLVPAYLTISFLVLVLFTFLAAIAPARRASRQSIVDALGHV